MSLSVEPVSILYPPHRSLLRPPFYNLFTFLPILLDLPFRHRTRIAHFHQSDRTVSLSALIYRSQTTPLSLSLFALNYNNTRLHRFSSAYSHAAGPALLIELDSPIPLDS